MCVHRIAVKEKLLSENKILFTCHKELFSEKILLKQTFIFADSEKSNEKTSFFI